MVLDEEVQPLTSDSTKCGTARGIDGNCMDSIAICAIYAFLLSLCTFGESYLPKEQRLLCLGVWCLFEFFLSNRERLDLVFVTNAGVVGDDAWRALVCLKVRGTRQPTLFVLHFESNKSYAYGLPVRMLWERSCSYTNRLLKKTQVCACNFSPSLWVCVSQERGLMGCKSRERPTARPFLFPALPTGMLQA